MIQNTPILWKKYEKLGYSMRRHETSWNTRLVVHYCVMKDNENPQDTIVGGINIQKYATEYEHRQNITKCCEIAQKHLEQHENTRKDINSIQ